jgi:hypothetical protein
VTPICELVPECASGPNCDKHAAAAVSDSQLLRSLDLSGVVALVVEDHMDARELTKRVLGYAGAKVMRWQRDFRITWSSQWIRPL